MNKRRFLGFLLTALIGLVALTSLHTIAPWSVEAQASGKILVSAAISLKDALEEIKSQYQKSQPGVQISYNFGASGTLQQQIEQGAPVDLFISASKKQMNALQAKGLVISGTISDLASNQLVLIVPSTSKLRITSFKNLTDATVKRIAVGEPRSVPAGQYADQVFQKLGISNAIKSKLVYGNNVRQVLAAVESGNADAGVAYITDAKTTNKVRAVATASASDHAAIVYPMGILKSTKNETATRNFVRYLASSPAKAILKKYGFTLGK